MATRGGTLTLSQMRERCPNRAEHAQDEPSGYAAWHAWAEKKAETHRQSACSGCGLYVIWTPKRAGGITDGD